MLVGLSLLLFALQDAPQYTSLSVSPSGEIVEGSSVTLTCSSNANPPVQNYTWFKTDGSINTEERFRQHLKLSPIKISDSGQYYCTANNYIGSQNSRAERVDVKYTPVNTSVSVSPSGEIVEGSSVTLTCSSNANPPVENYTWFKTNGAAVWENGSGQSLTIAEISSGDSGQYYCEAQNKHGAHNSTAVTVDVQYAPKNTSVSVSPSGEIVEGSSVTLTCSSNANPPVQNYTWFKTNGAAFWENGSGQSFNITEISSGDSGQYYCEAQNRYGNQTSIKITLNILNAPKNTSVSGSPSGEIVEGSSVTLTCSSNANPPVQNYTWFKTNGAAVWEKGSGQSFTITEISSGDSGQYYCEARNSIGAHNSNATTLIVPARLSVAVLSSALTVPVLAIAIAVLTVLFLRRMKMSASESHPIRVVTQEMENDLDCPQADLDNVYENVSGYTAHQNAEDQLRSQDYEDYGVNYVSVHFVKAQTATPLASEEAADTTDVIYTMINRPQKHHS
ncbi:B-cell receptor CD22 isoform X2 [Amia ocellicauda]|uniref:B-cell receptor CD22 isoform X2 n=1 Tax=Amia ocellicauda TaxID=2972642 RepID=UPI003463E2BA